MARAFPVALFIAVLLAFGGFLGAAAFNPDDGFLLHSRPLWQAFGIASYVGFAGLLVSAVVALAAYVRQLRRRTGD